MANDQPGGFTIFDLFRELIHVTLIAVGCYIGWKMGNNFWSLLVGGIVGRTVGLTAQVWINAKANAAE
jgi:hypothetical protein